jgi:NAD-dependent deacetylase
VNRLLPAAIAEVVVNADNVVVLTGAGISAESGIATFRGTEGLWSKFRPEELANLDAFLTNPQRIWEWYQHRRGVLLTAKPNSGHHALVRWEQLVPEFLIVTQNVDGLHQQAGSKKVFELHGNIRINRCLKCAAETTMDVRTLDGRIPYCACGGMLRPGVVWFGEVLPEETLRAAVIAAKACDLLVSVGTSSVVYPAAALPEIALEQGAVVLEINPEETPLTKRSSYHLRGTAGALLPQVVAMREAERGTAFSSNSREP